MSFRCPSYDQSMSLSMFCPQFVLKSNLCPNQIQLMSLWKCSSLTSVLHLSSALPRHIKKISGQSLDKHWNNFFSHLQPSHSECGQKRTFFGLDKFWTDYGPKISSKLAIAHSPQPTHGPRTNHCHSKATAQQLPSHGPPNAPPGPTTSLLKDNFVMDNAWTNT